MRAAVPSILVALALVSSAPPLVGQATQTAQKPVRPPDIHWVPTPDAVVDGMLKLAGVGKGDTVYDLGCGDGKIVIAAARLGARGVGIDIDPQRVAEATANVKKAGVQDRVQIRLGDIFDPAVTINEATVVTLYLLSSLNEKLMPRLKAELRPGTRIVSHAFRMGDWQPERTEQINGINIFLWTIPKR
jgi:cyclopropane fatty-acyl-phospholipid synthase-like methyltransferase